MTAWLRQHRQAFATALRRLGAVPLGTVLSLLVIGIALTLPAAGYVLIDNARHLAAGPDGRPQISLFLSLDATRDDVAGIEARLARADVGKWRFVPKDEALKSMQASAELAEVVAALPRNPLPDAFVVEPRDADPARLEALAKTFAGWPRVAHVQLDSAWVRRLDAFVRLGRLAVLLFAGVFAAAMVAVTFNTIRLQILAEAAEIEVAKLIGATDAFIRRPFYYYGALQGALGGALAAGLVAAGVALLAPGIAAVAALYGSDFALAGLSAAESAGLVAAGAGLGWLGAQLSVGVTLRRYA